MEGAFYEISGKVNLTEFSKKKKIVYMRVLLNVTGRYITGY